MQFRSDFRDTDRMNRLLGLLARRVHPDRTYRIMEFCGGHTHALCSSGLIDRLPKQILMVHGPGCPVCVLPTGRLQQAMDLALSKPVILATYGDMLRVPGRGQHNLVWARSMGADVRVVYSVEDALELARRQPQRQVVFLAVGFETTTPMTAAAVAAAAREALGNFTVLCNHVLTPPSLHALLADEKDRARIDGFVGPGHVSTIIGSAAFWPICERYKKPIAISGFEPVDLVSAIWNLVEQLNAGECVVHNGFPRAVSAGGNVAAQQQMAQVFAVTPTFAWRGLGQIAHSALKLRDEFADFDAERRFDLPSLTFEDHKACRCSEVLRGLCLPTDCSLFGTACTEDTPLGSCMVSSEGACAAYTQLGRPPKRRPLPTLNGPNP